MLTFRSLGGPGIRLDYGKSFLAIFPQGEALKDATLTLFSVPDLDAPKETISWPGEYDYDGVAVQGIGHDEGKTVSYAIQVDGVRCAFLSSPLQPLNDEQLEDLGDVDVLCIPTDDPKLIQKLVDEIDPRVLIPVKTGGDDKYAEALKVCGASGVSPEKEYKIKGSLPAEGREVVILES